MSFLFFFKPLADLLYKLRFLDIILVYILIYFLIKGRKFQLIALDYVVLALGTLFFFSFLRDVSGFASIIKIESSFLIYFVGRQYFQYWEKYTYALQKGFLIILLVTFFSFVTGTGFQMWGTHNTFSGYYFFKTDAAAALAQCMIFFAFVSFSKKYQKYLILLSSTLLIFLTNARIYYLIVAVIYLAIYLFYKENQDNYSEIKYKINLKLIITCFFLFAIVILIMAFIVSSYDSSLLLVDLSDKGGLMSAKNTQGRSVVWERILTYFNEQGTFTQLFGVDLVKDEIIGVICESHNLYLKLLFATGYVGLVLFLYFMYKMISILNQLTHKRLYYTVLSLFAMYAISGISFSSILSTQLSWLPMFYAGVIVSVNVSHKELLRDEIVE